MIERRYVAAFILAAFPPSAWAEPPRGVEAAVQRHQSELSAILMIDCRRGQDDGAIMVCGKRERSPYRLLFELPPEPGARRTGEPVDQREIMALNPERCAPPRQRPQSEGLDLLAVAVTVATVAASVADDGLPPAEPRPVKNCG